MSYVIKEPDAPITYKQGIMIRNLGGGDVRGENLTRQQASDRIGELMKTKETVGKNRSYKSWTDLGTGETSRTVQINYSDLFARASKTGMEAGLAALPTPMVVSGYEDEPVMDGACGFADVNFKMKSGLARKFGRWLIDNDHARKDDYRGGVTIWISDHGQSVERKAAHASAMAKVLQEAGIDAYSSSRLD